MLIIEDVLLHDKKRNKHWSTVTYYFKGLYGTSIVETNLKTLDSKINWARLNVQEEQIEIAQTLGYKTSQSILNELTEEQKELILRSVRESEILKQYI